MRTRQLLAGSLVLAAGFGAGLAVGAGGRGPTASGGVEPGEVARATSPGGGAPGAAAPNAGISRTTLVTVDSPGGHTHEVVMGVAELPPGAESGNHIHPGIEVGYVLEGTVELRHDGRPTELLQPGGSFMNDSPHNAINVGDGPARILAVWIVEKGQPLSSPAP